MIFLQDNSIAYELLSNVVLSTQKCTRIITIMCTHTIIPPSGTGPRLYSHFYDTFKNVYVYVV